MQAIPLHDRLGFRRTRAGTEYARNVASTAIPNNESIILLNWSRHDLGGSSTDHFTNVGPFDQATGDRVSFLRNADTMKLGSNDGAAWQTHDIPIPDSGDHLWCVVLDRDNTLLDAYLDSVLVGSAAIARDPNLNIGNNWILFNNSTGGASSHFSNIDWRGIIISCTNGATPTQAQLSEAFRAMLDPHAPLHATLSAAIGSCYNDYNLGEGLYGSATITDNGTSGDDLTIQGGLTIDDIRARARASARIPRRTFYTLTSGYTGTTGAVDFGFAVQPVIVRVLFSHLRGLGSQDITLMDAGVTDYIYLETVGGVRRLNVKGQIMNLDGDQADNGGDLWVVCNGTNVDVHLGGQDIGNLTIASALDLTGNCTVGMDGRTSCCRVAAWNPASVPGTLAQEIRDCAMDSETDPPSLTAKAVDFPLDSERLPLGTSTTCANKGTGGGTFTLSAQRSTSCAEMFHGWSP